MLIPPNEIKDHCPIHWSNYSGFIIFLSDRAISLKWEVEQIALSIGEVRVYIAPQSARL